MKNLNYYLDVAKEKTGQDGVTAQKIGMTAAGISKARKRGTLSPDNIVKLAQLINVNPAEIHMACDIARDPNARAIWQRWAVTAALIMGILVLDINVGNQALAMAPATVELYIMRNLLWRSWGGN